MKDWFKYKYGYVNLDLENIYFTNSGNWSETFLLTENSKLKNKENKSKRNWMWFFVIVSLSLLSFSILNNLYNLRIGIWVIIIPYAMYYIYENFKRETGDSFKIPLKKISEIKIEDQSIIFSFVNGDGIGDEFKIEDVEDKGIVLISALRNNLNSQVQE